MIAMPSDPFAMLAAKFAQLDRPSRNFTIALAVSLLLHAILLSLHFRFPDALSHAKERALDVVLVNSKSASKPLDAQARAQANLDGGGNTDENRRAATPLPVLKQTQREGESVAETQRRVAEMEKQQRLMTQAKNAISVQNNTGKTDPRLSPTTTPVSGLDLASNAMAMVRIEAQIDRNIDEYNKRPRKRNFGARVEEYRFAQYVEGWRQKIERIGNLNYPESARGRLFGSLVLTVAIRSDGSAERIEINRPSPHKLLDEAALRIVRLASPFAPFPPDIRRDTDIIEITRTWSFTNADKLQSN